MGQAIGGSLFSEPGPAPYPKLLCLVFQTMAEGAGVVSPSTPTTLHPITIDGGTIEGDVK